MTLDEHHSFDRFDWCLIPDVRFIISWWSRSNKFTLALSHSSHSTLLHGQSTWEDARNPRGWNHSHISGSSGSRRYDTSAGSTVLKASRRSCWDNSYEWRRRIYCKVFAGSSRNSCSGHRWGNSHNDAINCSLPEQGMIWLAQLQSILKCFSCAYAAHYGVIFLIFPIIFSECMSRHMFQLWMTATPVLEGSDAATRSE